jgi:hypothetical protein
MGVAAAGISATSDTRGLSWEFEGREGTDRWAPCGCDRGTGNGNGPLAREIGMGGTAVLG